MSIRYYVVPVALAAAGVAWALNPPRKNHQHRVTVGTGLEAARAVAAPAATAAPVAVVRVRTIQDDWCRDGSDHDRGWFCEVREFNLSAGALRNVDASPNGSISVSGWDRSEIRVSAKVQGYARTDEIARELVDGVRIAAGGPTLEAGGPRTERRESWSVSYRISVPYDYDLSLNTTNGGVSIDHVSGQLDFRTTNGGVTLVGVGGDVQGRTTNGGLKIELEGDAWEGAGLDVRTTNGGVKLAIPEGYNAVLESGTTNGGLSVDFPITVSGRIDRRLRTELGQGGAPIRVTTTNGGVSIRRR